MTPIILRKDSAEPIRGFDLLAVGMSKDMQICLVKMADDIWIRENPHSATFAEMEQHGSREYVSVVGICQHNPADFSEQAGFHSSTH